MNIRIQWLLPLVVIMSLMLVGCAQPVEVAPQVVVVTVEVTVAPEEAVIEEEAPAEEEVDIEATVQAGIDAAIAATKAVDEAVQAALAATQAAKPAQPSASDTLAAQPTNTPVPAAPAAAVAPTATPVPPPTAAPVVQTTASEAKVIYQDGDYNNGVGTYASDKTPWLDLLVNLNGIWYGPERGPEDGINAVPLPAGYRWTAGGGFGANPNGEAWWDGPNYLGEAILYDVNDTLIIKVPLAVEFYSVGGSDDHGKKCDDHDPNYPDCSSHNDNNNHNNNSSHNDNSSHNSNDNHS